jgi:hypothetical protein
VGREHVALGRHEQVDVLQNVEEELVPAVLDVLPAPANLACDLGRDLGLLLLGRRLDALLRDERLERPGLRVLRIPVVEQLCREEEKKKRLGAGKIVEATLTYGEKQPRFLTTEM